MEGEQSNTNLGKIMCDDVDWLHGAQRLLDFVKFYEILDHLSDY
jgi:hypothetical protein